MAQFKIINRNKRTHWNIGALVDQVTPFDNTGFAMFTKGGAVAIHAHRSEVQPTFKRTDLVGHGD